jgi:hypothetical protein
MFRTKKVFTLRWKLGIGLALKRSENREEPALFQMFMQRIKASQLNYF